MIATERRPYSDDSRCMFAGCDRVTKGMYHFAVGTEQFELCLGHNAELTIGLDGRVNSYAELMRWISGNWSWPR